MPSPYVYVHRPWGLVVVHGPDATSFLQAIVSQDLDPVAPGETVASLLLQPQGKLDVAFRATRRRGAGGPDGGGDEWWLDTDGDHGPRLAAGLARYRIRVKAEIDDRTATSACASIVGTADPGPVPGNLVVMPPQWGGVDVVGEAGAVAAWLEHVDLPHATAPEWEAARIEAGRPRLGVDVDESTIPQEAFLEADGVSFTKGCFIGQELVCRIDSRGHVNRFLRRLAIPGAEVPEAGAEVVAAGKVTGRVTSAAAVPGGDRVVALAMIRREVEPPAEVVVTIAGRPHAATVLP